MTKKICWSRWLSYFLKELNAAGISSTILYTCSPYQHYERGIGYKELAEKVKELFNNETLTPQDRVCEFVNFGA